jgi:hypothetical protein
MARAYRTDARLWATAAGLVAVGLGFVPFLPSGKGDPPSFWAQVGDLLAGRGLESVGTFVWDALLVAAGAAVGGWLLQAVAVVLLGRPPADPGAAAEPSVAPDRRPLRR